MLSTHIDPFTAFTKDLQIPGCDVHIYYGPTVFGSTWDEGMLGGSGAMPMRWRNQNIYFLAGVRPRLAKRAADSDVLMRGMFTLDFDIKNELQKKGVDIDLMGWADRILDALETHPQFSQFRYAVMSGNGLHVHYFGNPCRVVKEEWVAGMKEVFALVASITPLPPDFGCGNAGRIMRMPGSWNVKDPAHPLPVEFLVWNPGASFGDLSAIQARGSAALASAAAAKTAEREEFASSAAATSSVIQLINSIPIEQVVWKLLGCRSKEKPGGGIRFIDEDGKERGFFKHKQYNVIVHEGTSLFAPPNGVGYNCLGLVEAVKGIGAREAIAWFCEHSAAVRRADDAERSAWAEMQRKNEEIQYLATHFPQ